MQKDKCARRTTFLSNIIVYKAKEKCPYQLLLGSKPKLPTILRIFREMGSVTTKDDIQGKLKNRRMACIFVGYSVDHTNDANWMLNITSKRIVHTIDVVWLGTSYVRAINNTPSRVNNADDIEDFICDANNNDGTQVTQVKDQSVKSKVYWLLNQLESSINPDASKIVKDTEQGRDIILEQINIDLFS